MTQESIVLRTTGLPYEGVDVLTDTNNAFETLASDFAGSVDPALDETKGVKANMTWADLGNGFFKRRNAANDAWVVEAILFRKSVTEYPLADVPTTDKGAIYVPEIKGTMSWDTGTSAYKADNGSMAKRDVTVSTSDPSGGVDGDVWLKV